MTPHQDSLRLFVKVVALACFCMGLAGYAAYVRLDDVAGRPAFVSPYFSAVVIFCGFALYAARIHTQYARACGIAVMCAMVLAGMASHWSDAWINGRIVSSNSATALILLGAVAAVLLRHSIKPKANPPARSTVAVALLGVSMSTLIAYALIEDDIVGHQQFAMATVETIARDIEDRIAQPAALMRRLDERWDAVEHIPSQAMIEQEFDSYMRDFPFFHSFTIVDYNRSVIRERKRGAPPEWTEGSVADRGLHDCLGRLNSRGQAYAAVRKQASWDGKAGLSVLPLFNLNMKGLLVVACVDLASIFAEATSRAEGVGYFRISRGNRVLYQTAGVPPPQAFAAGDITIPMQLDLDLQLSYLYAKAPNEISTEVLPEFVLLAGTLLTFFLISSLRLTRIAGEHSTQLSHCALHDPLTGLPNRRMLEQILSDACIRAKSQNLPVSVVLFDLDGIKLINDSMGHDVGDRLLMEVAARLQRGVQRMGSVTRLGGDEFVLLFFGIDLPHTQQHTRRLIGDLSKPYLIADTNLRVTASAGIAISNGDIKDPMQLVREADLAMLRAKQEGRNTCHTYTVDMSARVAERLELRNDLQSALDANRLELHYQPIVDGHSGRVIGVEGLLRWPHPTRGYISPSRFIPLAEETGQIIPLTDWVLAIACRDSAILRKNGLPPFPVIVNISPLYFQRVDFVQNISRALHNTALSAEFLEIEITEGVLLDNEDAAILKLAELREMGVRTSIDDFGTGYSSLNYLKHLPIDKIKIDRSFVVDVVTDPADAAITQGIISMAHHLGLKVVAEGVETESQFAFLKRSHCDHFQGYLFARPMGFEALVDKLSKDGCRLTSPEPLHEPACERVLLLVDDEKNILNALTRLLRRDGYRILTANGPAQAFDLLAKHRIHVIVSDQRMPNMNGTEFFSKIKDMYPDTIRMILSGYTDLNSVTEAINRGAIYKFITKPWDDEVLRKEVEHAFKKVAFTN